VVTRAGNAVSANALYMWPHDFVNVLAGRLREDESRRFSRYLCLGQQPSDDEQFGAATAQVMGEALDPGVQRKRVRVIHAETPVTPEAAARRADLELRSALVDAWAAEYTVQGWRGSAGRLWRSNELVPIEDQLLDLSGAYLLVEVTYTLNASGTLSLLRFALPAAMDPNRSLGA
jgi:prophage tail gpP-like protein